jgi:hypothetical protein
MKKSRFCRDFLKWEDQGLCTYQPVKVSPVRSAGFYQCSDALCAQYFANLTPTFKNRDPLKVGAESAPGGFLRPGSISAEGRLLPTIFAYCHDHRSFHCKICTLPCDEQSLFNLRECPSPDKPSNVTTNRICLQDSLFYINNRGVL